MTEFRPMLTPHEMLKRGVFGGNYFANATKADYAGLGEALPLAKLNARLKFDKNVNFYGAKAGETFAQWDAKGWIFPEDPLGWFHWYCRYHDGWRHDRDALQIRRFNNYRARWGRFARTQMLTKGSASAVVKQGLLQWALDPIIILNGDSV